MHFIVMLGTKNEDSQSIWKKNEHVLVFSKVHQGFS